MSGFPAFVQGHGTATPAPTASPKDGVPGRASAVAPVGGVAVAATPAPAPAPADAMNRAAAAAPREEAAPGRHAGGSTAGGRTGSEVRNGSLPGTVESQLDN